MMARLGIKFNTGSASYFPIAMTFLLHPFFKSPLNSLFAKRSSELADKKKSVGRELQQK